MNLVASNLFQLEEFREQRRKWTEQKETAASSLGDAAVVVVPVWA
jgi:hypothetical protein